MALVDYSDSDQEPSSLPAVEKRKRKASSGDARDTSALPALPVAFRDLYSSTVRTSTRDDPLLHGGRKRATPHVSGNWPTHVYLEWCPHSEDYSLLSSVLKHVRQAFIARFAMHECPAADKHGFHSLLENELGVRLPLHVSLSRPLALKTSQKDSFLAELKTCITATGVSSFSAKPLDLVWHPNEDHTRWFLVLRLARPSGDELRKLLVSCNDLAKHFKQPLLYGSQHYGSGRLAEGEAEELHDSFHISIAWSLHRNGADTVQAASGLPHSIAVPLQVSLGQTQIKFEDVKVRIGQDVTSLPLRRTRSSSATS